jgi:hypothetical protein
MAEVNQQETKALVLGGGGTTGIAWEMGINTFLIGEVLVWMMIRSKCVQENS